MRRFGRSKYSRQPTNANCFNRFRPTPLINDEPRLVKAGETYLVEFGRIYQKIGIERTPFGTAGRLYLHVGSTALNNGMSLQIEEWKISPRDLDKSIKTLRTGMMIAVIGHRRSIAKPSRTAYGMTYQQLNIVDQICVLSTETAMADDFIKEMKIYDQTIKSQE